MLLNATKSEVWSASGAVPPRLAALRVLSPEGFELLGSPVGSAAFSQSFFTGKLAKFRSLWEGISRLPHLQTQTLLLRFCASFCKVVHVLRTVPPVLLGGCLTEFDDQFRKFMEVVTGPHQTSRGPS